jgi:hypothetical protein
MFMINTRVGSPSLCAFRKVPKCDLLGSQHPAQTVRKEGSEKCISENYERGVIPRLENLFHAANALVKVEEKIEW